MHGLNSAWVGDGWSWGRGCQDHRSGAFIVSVTQNTGCGEISALSASRELSRGIER